MESPNLIVSYASELVCGNCERKFDLKSLPYRESCGHYVCQKCVHEAFLKYYEENSEIVVLFICKKCKEKQQERFYRFKTKEIDSFELFLSLYFQKDYTLMKLNSLRHRVIKPAPTRPPAQEAATSIIYETPKDTTPEEPNKLLGKGNIPAEEIKGAGSRVPLYLQCSMCHQIYTIHNKPVKLKCNIRKHFVCEACFKENASYIGDLKLEFKCRTDNKSLLLPIPRRDEQSLPIGYYLMTLPDKVIDYYVLAEARHFFSEEFATTMSRNSMTIQEMEQYFFCPMCDHLFDENRYAIELKCRHLICSLCE